MLRDNAVRFLQSKPVLDAWWISAIVEKPSPGINMRETDGQRNLVLSEQRGMM